LKDILFVHPSRANGAHQWTDRRRPKPAQKRLGTYCAPFSYSALRLDAIRKHIY
jgi:hypothetical protein